MLDPLTPGSMSRPSDHGPDASALTWECGNNCGAGFAERPPDREMSRCSEPGCGEPEGTWMCPDCRKGARCECCQEPYCFEHLTNVPCGDESEPEGHVERWCAACLKAMTCPQCGEIKDDIQDYDWGMEQQTGYHDAGRACAECRGKR